MKKQLLTTILTVAVLTIFAQEIPTKSKIYYNEFGIDATNFVKQFLNSYQGQYYTYYLPTYYLTYRRHLKSGNIRFAIGGNFTNQDIPVAFVGDSNQYHSNSYLVDARIGWEFFSELSKRWQVYYGLDFRPSFSYSKNDAQYWNGGYANGFESEIQIYAIAPILGFRYRFTKRLSLITEASFSLNWQNTSSKRYYIPINSQSPPIPDEVTPNTKKTFSNFSQPLSLILTFDI